MASVLKGRLMGCKFKTFRGAAERASFERWTVKTHQFTVVDADAFDRANGWAFRILKVKRVAS